MADPAASQIHEPTPGEAPPATGGAGPAPAAAEELVEHGPVPPRRLVRGREADSLGWLSESGVMPKKQKAIEGVGASSIVDLKAQLYRTQEEVKMHKEGTLDPRERQVRRGAGINVGELMGPRNAGVEARDARDRLEIKGTDRASECYAALEKKAELYERIARGEAPENDEVYSVDFLRKGYLEDEAPPGRPRGGGFDDDDGAAPPPPPPPGGPGGSYDEGDRERREWEEDSWRDLEDEKMAEHQRRERRQVVEELVQQTRAGRERAQSLKARREEQATRNRDKLKMAYLAKQAKKRAGGGAAAPGNA